MKARKPAAWRERERAGPDADAMLETWKYSYFQNPGLKLFYLVPDEWLGYFLPLNLSIPHELTRVIVGRIDLLRR